MESPPSSQWATALGLLAVAALWGCTNPLLNKASQGMEQRPASSPAVLASSSAATTSAPRSLLRRLACDTAYLLTNWRFLLPFAINQAGSALFLVALGHAEMSLVVPLTNSLTFVFTALTSMWMGEAHTHNATVWLGMSLIVLGTGVCLSSKQQPP